MKKTIITGLICFLIPIFAFAFLVKFVKDEVNLMSTNQRLSKTENYTEIAKETFENATVFFGDSITELCPLNEVYSDYINQTGVQVINRGISGETTSMMLERIESNVLSIRPRNLVMLMGINDLAEDVSQDQIVDNIAKMIDLTKDQSEQTNVILEAVFPIRLSSREHLYEKVQMGNRTNEQIKELNEKLEQLAKEKDVTFLDLTNDLVDENGELKEEYTFDGLHLNIDGYMQIKDKVIACLK